MAAHSSILAWKIPQTKEPGRLQSMGSESDTTECTRARAHTHTHTHTHSLSLSPLPHRGHQLTISPMSTGINIYLWNMLAFTHTDTCASLWPHMVPECGCQRPCRPQPPAWGAARGRGGSSGKGHKVRRETEVGPAMLWGPGGGTEAWGRPVGATGGPVGQSPLGYKAQAP